MELPTTGFVIREGGWDPRYARVLVVGGNGSAAVALVDTNGDGQGIEECFFLREGGVWREGSSSGFASTAYGSVGHGESLGHVIAYGRVKTPGPVTRVVRGVDIHAEANAEGWWAAAAPRPDTE